MPTFSQLKCDDDLKQIIKTAYDADLDISGAWGYTQDEATVIHASASSIEQMEHMLASMRSYTEMNMTLPKEKRYGSINVNEFNREKIKDNNLVYDKVTYSITAIKEETYNAFIKEYKENYGKSDFNLTKHFEERKKATLTREDIYWFEIHEVI